MDLKGANVTTTQMILHVVRTRMRLRCQWQYINLACFLFIYPDMWRKLWHKHVYV